MARFGRLEARDWARAEMRGVCNVIIPSYTSDLRGLNEAGIRHDVRREIELGFKGALLVAETALTRDEYVQMVEWAADEAGDDLVLIFHASFNTLAENIEMAKRCQEAGTDLVLLSYPPSFYPRSLRDVYDYTAAFCAETAMGVILFPVPLWGFERLHPASIPVEMLHRDGRRDPQCRGRSRPRAGCPPSRASPRPGTPSATGWSSPCRLSSRPSRWPPSCRCS